MIGIYKITNKINGKSYIGQSNDIERRFSEHKYKGSSSRIPLDMAIQDEGENNFTYEVIEECGIAELNERESYWIVYYNTIQDGYNRNLGGNSNLVGVNNPNAKLNEKDIYIIRQSYAQHKKQREVYELFKNTITFASFQNIWQGRSWPHIMPEVYSEENKNYYKYQTSLGENGSSAALTDKEVLEIRKRYATESAKSIYKDYKDKLAYQTLQQILWGRAYSHLPVYSKKQNKWITPNPVTTISESGE